MLLAVLSGFLLALAAPWAQKICQRFSGWVLSLLPAALTVYFIQQLAQVSSNQGVVFFYNWVPSLHINLSFYADGLSLLFAILISGVGTLIVIYTGGYLSGHAQLGRFYSFLLMFMASMLGLVLSNNLITLFIFWELTSLSSYFLIGFDCEKEASRSAALQALLVTGVGGLAMLVGFLLLGQAGGSLELSELLTKGDLLREHALYLPILILVLLGAFTKSAQFPFHFWLPNAMAAPTPVSAYLHSSTMVKAGVYLLARFIPILGETDAWVMIVTIFGGVTMLGASILCFQQTQFKRFLAYSTVASLGMFVMLLGFSTELAIKAAVISLLAHAFYKGALFMVAGCIDHATGEKHVDKVAGLKQKMPITAVAAILAAISMAGLPPLFGFIGKELTLETTWHAHYAAWWFTAATILTSMLIIGVSFITGVRPFIGKPVAATQKAHEPNPSLWLGPVVLAILGTVAGLFPGLLGHSLLSKATSAIAGKPMALHLALWHGWNPVVLLSLVAMIGGGVICIQQKAFRKTVSSLLAVVSKFGPEKWYQKSLQAMIDFSKFQTRIIQSGYLRYYLIIIILTTIGISSYLLVKNSQLLAQVTFSSVHFYEVCIVALIIVSTIAAVMSRTRLAAIATLGGVGLGVVMIFVFFSAPDLAMTQFVIETLTVILLVLVFYHLPAFEKLSKRPTRFRDVLISLSAGGFMTALVILTTKYQFYPSVSRYFTENSLSLGHGRNIVNVILVDFRGINTLGEITVLAVAGIGIYALLKLRLGKKENS